MTAIEKNGIGLQHYSLRNHIIKNVEMKQEEEQNSALTF